MRVLLLGNGRVAADLAREIRIGGDEICGLVVHPPERARDRPMLERAAGVGPDRTVEGHRLRDPLTHAKLRSFQPDIAVSAYFGFIVPPEVLEAVPQGSVNVHPSFLPHNRGAHPNVWSIVDRSPAGVTLHWMDQGIDTGPIIAQRQVNVEPVDTGASLYARLEDAAVALFRETWPAVRAGTAPRQEQPPGGSAHRVRDLDAIDCIDLNRTYTARQLLDLLRARSFPPYPGAFFEDQGKRVYLRLELSYADGEGDAPADLRSPSEARAEPS